MTAIGCNFFLFLFLRQMPKSANKLYKIGISTNVTKVETDKPQATVIPNEFHISAPSPLPTAKGIIPKTVVSVVIKMGRRRDFPAVTTASRTDMPRSRHRIV